jgi:cold shock CspA family protein
MSAEGVVILYDPEKGFGFIQSGSVDGDIFFHISEFDNEVLPSVGMKVTFDLKEGPDGRNSARNISTLALASVVGVKESDTQNVQAQRESQSSSPVFTARAKVQEGSSKAEILRGSFTLTEKVLRFEGYSGVIIQQGVVITRSLEFVRSVRAHRWKQSYVIQGDGPDLFVSSSKEFFRDEKLQDLIEALQERI